MSGLEEYIIDGDDLSRAQVDAMGQAVLRVMQPDAVRFQTDIPELRPSDPTRGARRRRDSAEGSR